MILLIKFILFSSSLLYPIEYLKNKNFQVEFIEKIFYENVSVVDTFRGTLISTDNVLEMHVKYPDKAIYKLKGDTLWTYFSETGDSSRDVIPGAYSWLNFDYLLNDSIFKLIPSNENNLITVFPRDTLAQFKEIRIFFQDSLVRRLEVKLEDRTIYFDFRNWRFL